MSKTVSDIDSNGDDPDFQNIEFYNNDFTLGDCL